MAQIPPLNPVGDTFSGVVLQYASATLLATQAIAETTALTQGTFTVRYAVRYLEKPHLAVVPGLVALDYGDMLTGERMWEFVLNRSNAYPRADVLGWRNDGAQEMVVLKKLDLAQRFQTLLYPDDTTSTPLFAVDAFIGTDLNALAARTQAYLPHYPTLEDWKNRPL